MKLDGYSSSNLINDLFVQNRLGTKKQSLIISYFSILKLGDFSTGEQK